MMRRTLAMGLKRMVFSRVFLLFAIAAPFFRLIGSVYWTEGDVMASFVGSSEMTAMSVALSAAPFAAIVARDLRNGAYLYYVQRCGGRSYALGGYAAAIISVMLCNAVGQWLYVGIQYCMTRTFFDADMTQLEYLAVLFGGQLMVEGRIFFYLSGLIACSSMVCAEFAALSVALCTINADEKMVCAMPFLLFHCASFLIWILGMPSYLQPAQQYIGSITLTGNVAYDAAIVLSTFAVIIIPCGILFIRGVGRRVERA